MRARWVGLMVTVGLGAAFGLLQLLSSSASAASASATQRVIVVFRDQDPGQPASGRFLVDREASFRSSRAAVLAQMAATGASSIRTYTIVNAASATVTTAEVARLRSDRAVSEVIPDAIIPAPDPAAPFSGLSAAGSPTSAGSGSGAKPLPGTCAAPGKVELEPQAVETINAVSDVKGAKTARSLGVTGAGVKVAFLADGLDIDNPNYIRPDGKHVFVDYKDFSGDGTGAPTGGIEAFLDSASIAAQGTRTYNISNFTATPLDRRCNIRIEGVAPGASLVGLDVFGTVGGFESSILEAIDYAVTVDHVNVMNESFGSNDYPDDSAALDLIKRADDAAIAAGTVVTVSTGDSGPGNTIGSPSSDPDVISAAASTTERDVAQIGFGAPGVGHITGWLNDNVSTLSSSGYEQSGRTVDLIAPGDSAWIPCSTDVTIYTECTSIAGKPTPINLVGGTSESAPLTAGVAALVIQAYRETHHGATPSPALVKRLILSNTDDIGAPADLEGTGRLDAYKAVLAAEGVGRGRGAGAGAGTTLVSDSATQLNAVAAPHTPETFRDAITNVSRRTETLYLHTRALGAFHGLKQGVVTLSNNTSSHGTDVGGQRLNIERFSFRVPAGENRLSVSLSFPAPLTAGPASLTLVDPAGRATSEFTIGNTDYANVQAADPKAGGWTAIIVSPISQEKGYSGPVIVQASAARYTGFGAVTPSRVTLAPGRSTPVVLRTRTPAAGDASGAIVISSRRGASGGPDADNEARPINVTSVPVTLRSVLPSGNASVTGATTGGNLDTPIAGQTFYYALDVRPGTPELNASVTLADNPDYTFQAVLVDPKGEGEAYTSNVWIARAFSASPGPATALPGATLHALKPEPGRWTLVISFAPAAGGTRIAEPFTVATNDHAVLARGGGLPDSTSKTLSSRPHSFEVTVRNTGTAPGLFFVDARRPGSTRLSLGAVTTADLSVPATTTTLFPQYLVPTDSTAFTARATTNGGKPVQFDTSSPVGDPDIASSSGSTATASFSAHPVAPGEWGVFPVIHGVFGSAGAPSEAIATTFKVTTRPFDPSVTASTGDVEADGVDPQMTLPNFAPIVIAPGATGRIRVTVLPSGRPGSHDSGTLYVDEYADSAFLSELEPLSEQVSAIPYRYTVK